MKLIQKVINVNNFSKFCNFIGHTLYLMYEIKVHFNIIDNYQNFSLFVHAVSFCLKYVRKLEIAVDSGMFSFEIHKMNESSNFLIFFFPFYLFIFILFIFIFGGGGGGVIDEAN